MRKEYDFTGAKRAKDVPHLAKLRRLKALERIQPLLDHPPVQLGDPRPSKDELNER